MRAGSRFVAQRLLYLSFQIVHASITTAQAECSIDKHQRLVIVSIGKSSLRLSEIGERTLHRRVLLAILQTRCKHNIAKHRVTASQTR